MIVRFLCYLLFLMASGTRLTGQDTISILQGYVTDAESGQPLPGANVMVKGTNRGTATDQKGAFSLSVTGVANFTIMVRYIGFQPWEKELIPGASISDIAVRLQPVPIPLKSVVVTPGQFGIMKAEPSASQTLSRKEIETLPQFGEDIYRAISRLPGISSNDFSARFTIRGSEHDEILVLMDGLELYEPFHMKDIYGGALSIVDANAIQGIDIMSGGFPANYGDRMSGVFNMQSRVAPRSTRHSVGISFMNARLLSEGNFANGRGAWLFMARRGYIDLVLKLMGTDDSFDPTYYDLFGKIRYNLNKNHILAIHGLYARDDLNMVEDDDDVSATNYGNGYLWAKLNSSFGRRITAATVASAGLVTSMRDGTAFIGDTGALDFSVLDRRHFYTFGLKQDWSFEISNNYLISAGFDVKHQEADYDYLSQQTRRISVTMDSSMVLLDSTNLDLKPSGERIGLFFSNRFKPVDFLTTELGIRYDRTSYTGDDLVSPRVNLVVDLPGQTGFRAAWGRFYQSQGINEIAVQDGEGRFYKAETSVHWLAGIEHTTKNGLNARLDLYRKRVSDLRPHYFNWLNDLEIFPELQDDRVGVLRDHSTAKGIELYLKRDTGGKFTWWASYALSWVRDDVTSILADGVEYPFNMTLSGNYDQRHTFYFDINYRPNEKWHFNAAWQYRSGLPYTEKVLRQENTGEGARYYVTNGEISGERYPAFHRLDIRFNRYFTPRFKGFLEVVNLYNRGNVRTYWYDFNCDGQHCFLDKNADTWFTILPSIGLSWSWE